MQFAHARDQRRSNTRCRVHRQIERDDVRTHYGALAELVLGCVGALDGKTGTPQPGGGRRQSERLAPQFVRRYQEDAHEYSTFIVLRGADPGTERLRYNFRVSKLLALFPLDAVLFPGAPLPLHIFEPRYKEMMRDLLESREHFGVVRTTEGGFEQIGCTAEI